MLHEFFVALAHHQVVLVFVVIGIGMLLGRQRVKGISLGAAAVLFVALGVAAAASRHGVKLTIDHQIGTLGLALFAFVVGIMAGPNFFHILKTSGRLLALVIGCLIVSAGSAYALGTWWGLDIATTAGAWAGAVTNTPALAAAGAASGDAARATVGYSVTYLFGVLCMIALAQIALRWGRDDHDLPVPLANMTVVIERDDLPSVGELAAEDHVRFSRIQTPRGVLHRPALDEQLHKGDIVTIVAPKDRIDDVAREIGSPAERSLMLSREQLDFRRITVSEAGVIGRTLEELSLGPRYGAGITRIRRGDVDVIATPDMTLQPGDRVRVVAPRAKMATITRELGDSERGLADINPVVLALGIAAGLGLGMIPIPIPGGTFAIGSAAGTLLVGLIFGRIATVGHVPLTMPHPACLVLQEIGLLLFLAYAGSTAGSQILGAFASGAWLPIAGVGAVATIVLGVTLLLTMSWLRLGGEKLAGLMAGVQTQPAVLAYANERTSADPRIGLGWSMVYPVAMVMKILIAQVLGGL